MLSNLDIFKIGIGPSSSHTLGPMLSARDFCSRIEPKLESIERIEIILYGSLSLTGRGHLTDSAVIWGLCNLECESITEEQQKHSLSLAREQRVLLLCGRKKITFNPILDIVFSKEFKKEHENALSFHAFDKKGQIVCNMTYFSIGGGFIKRADEMVSDLDPDTTSSDIFYIKSAKDAIKLCTQHNLNLASLSLKYELQFNSHEYITGYLKKIWHVMQEIYQCGVNTKKEFLPGPLHLKRRAPALARNLLTSDDPLSIIDNISLYAIAIAEENASGARVVTAPTNGACAVIPATMLYLKNSLPDFDDCKASDFLLTAMLIGSLYRQNASISGAEAGCQAEIGSASSMAAGAMTTVLGGSAIKACNAAEIAMEHHLGLTCDPVYGLVQIPCIERNAFGAIKAISAARIALSGDEAQKVKLDEIIDTMYKTGRDMSYKYKETALGGLACIIK